MGEGRGEGRLSRPVPFASRPGRWVTYLGGSTTYWSYATFPIPDAGSRLVGWLFPRVIELSGERLAELVKRPD